MPATTFTALRQRAEQYARLLLGGLRFSNTQERAARMFEAAARYAYANDITWAEARSIAWAVYRKPKDDAKPMLVETLVEAFIAAAAHKVDDEMVAKRIDELMTVDLDELRAKLLLKYGVIVENDDGQASEETIQERGGV